MAASFATLSLQIHTVNFYSSYDEVLHRYFGAKSDYLWILRKLQSRKKTSPLNLIDCVSPFEISVKLIRRLRRNQNN